MNLRDFAALSAERNRLEKENEALVTGYDEMGASLRQETAKVEALHERLRMATEENTALGEEAARLRELHEADIAMAGVVSGQLENLLQARSESDKAAKKLEAENAQLKEIDKQTRAILPVMRQELEGLQKAADELTQEKAKLLADNDALLQRARDAEASLGHAEADRLSLASQSENANRRADSAENAARAVKAERETELALGHKLELAKVKRAAQAQAETVEALQAENVWLTKTREEITQQLAALRKQYDKIAADLQKQTAISVQKTKEHSAAIQALSQMMADNEASERAIEEMRKKEAAKS